MPPLVFVLALALFATFSDKDWAAGVQITDLRVPAAVQNGSSSGALLDCEYSLRPDELSAKSGLVVKWFFNNGPAPVYQWIPRQKPQDLGILKGKLDLEYRASGHQDTMYRALFIVNPTTELSGDYKCCVSTFQDEDFMIKKMIVYAPEKKFEVSQTKTDTDSVTVTCRAQGAYPQPNMTLFKSPDKKNRWPIEGVRLETKRNQPGIGYDITGTVVLEADDSPIGCQLTIPKTPYTKTKFVNYFPGSVESLSSVSGGSPMRWLGGVCIYLLSILLVSMTVPPSC